MMVSNEDLRFSFIILISSSDPILCFMPLYLRFILIFSDVTITVNGKRECTWRRLKNSDNLKENLLAGLCFFLNLFRYKLIFKNYFKYFFSFSFLICTLSMKQHLTFQLFPINILAFHSLRITCVLVAYFPFLIMFCLLIMTSWSLYFSTKWLGHI